MIPGMHCSRGASSIQLCISCCKKHKIRRSRLLVAAAQDTDKHACARGVMNDIRLHMHELQCFGPCQYTRKHPAVRIYKESDKTVSGTSKPQQVRTCSCQGPGIW